MNDPFAKGRIVFGEDAQKSSDGHDPASREPADEAGRFAEEADALYRREEREPGETPKNAPLLASDRPKGPPKNLGSKIAGFLIPVAVVACVVWMFLPGDFKREKKEEPAVRIDEKSQNAQTAATFEELKEKSEKEILALKLPEPVPKTQPLPNETVSEEEKQKAKRLEEILASPLKSGESFETEKPHTATGSASYAATRTREAEENASTVYGSFVKAFSSGSPDAKGQGHTVSAPKSPDERFLADVSSNEIRSPVYQGAPVTDTRLLEGTVIRSVLLSALSSERPGNVTAMVTSDIYDSVTGNSLVIPKGSKLTGVYRTNVAVGQSRLLVAMTRLILPDGSSVSLSGTPGTSADGSSGIVGDVDNHFMDMFLSSFVIGAVSMLLPDDKTTISTSNIYGNGDISAGSVTAIALYEAVSALMERNKNIAPTISVNPGTEFSLVVSRDMVMRPFYRR